MSFLLSLKAPSRSTCWPQRVSNIFGAEVDAGTCVQGQGVSIGACGIAVGMAFSSKPQACASETRFPAKRQRAQLVSSLQPPRSVLGVTRMCISCPWDLKTKAYPCGELLHHSANPGLGHLRKKRTRDARMLRREASWWRFSWCHDAPNIFASTPQA